MRDLQKNKLPVLPLREVVLFPHMITSLAIGRSKSVRAVEKAFASDKLLLIITQRNSQINDPKENDLYPVGVIAEILQVAKIPDGTYKIVVEGIKRTFWEDLRVSIDGCYEARLIDFIDEVPAFSDLEVEAIRREVLALFTDYLNLNPKIPLKLSAEVSEIKDLSKFIDVIAARLAVKSHIKYVLLQMRSVKKRLIRLLEILTSEVEILKIEKRIHDRVKSQIEKTQKEYYLTEQMKAIKKELKQKDDFAKEIDEIKEKIKQAKMPTNVEEVAMKELARLEKMMPLSPEATVARTYLDWLISLPWSKRTKDNFDINRAEKILNEDHYGLKNVKERVIEYLSVLKRVKKIRGPILCFLGPPGTGKTSIAKSIAKALGRNFIRISLGGVRDEAEIRGHRRTYIGSLPGRIIQSLKKAKSKNPVFLLDEIDKMGTDWRGDPAAALLEVLDPEQNYIFSDHYLEVEFDLSEVMFITTANVTHTIHPTLLDRLEIIRFPGYTLEEKVKIAKYFLIPKQLKEHGFSDKELLITEEAIKKIIEDYTKEAGVRNLEREIANICRKAAKKLEKQKKKKIILSRNNVKNYLGKPKFYKEKISPNSVGVSTGLAWTERGGETLTIEVTSYKGKGKCVITGQLGDVMQESVKTSLSYVKSIAKKINVDPDIFQNLDFHIHIPEGAIPKDGPSAGIGIASAIISVVKNIPIKKDLAMTGELTLTGRVLPIGGFKEKILAGYRENIKTIIFPEENKKDLDDIPQKVKKLIKLIPVKRMEEVLNLALERSPFEKIEEISLPTYPQQITD